MSQRSGGKRLAEENRHIREAGCARDSEMGEVLRWNKGESQAMSKKYDLDNRDPDQARRNMDRFKRSADFKRYSTYKRKYF